MAPSVAGIRSVRRPCLSGKARAEDAAPLEDVWRLGAQVSIYQYSPKSSLAATILECGGRAKRRHRFGYGENGSRSGVALRSATVPMDWWRRCRAALYRRLAVGRGLPVRSGQMNPPPRQLEIEFNSAGSDQGFRAWHEQRRASMKRLAESLGLPLGHPVEVWLRGGVRLRGVLRLREEQLFVEEARAHQLDLVVDRVPFKAVEIESCIRTDC